MSQTDWDDIWLLPVDHSIIVIAYHIIRDGTAYLDLGANYFDERKKDAVQQQLVQRLENLGYKVVLEPLSCAA